MLCEIDSSASRDEILQVRLQFVFFLNSVNLYQLTINLGAICEKVSTSGVCYSNLTFSSLNVLFTIKFMW